MLSRRSLLAAPLLGMPFIPGARAAGVVRLGQATTSLSFLPIWAARARDDFTKQGVTLNWAAIPGGDPATLAALDSGIWTSPPSAARRRCRRSARGSRSASSCR